MIYGGYQGNDTGGGGALISYEDAFKNLKDVHYVIIYILQYSRASNKL